MPIWLDVNHGSGVPIYVQLVDQVKRALEVGTLRSGDKLPTVRQLASELAVAPNTIVKAYDELQKVGLIESRPGAGTVVAAQVEDTMRKQGIESLFERLRQIVHDAAGLGVGREELARRFELELARFYRSSGPAA